MVCVCVRSPIGVVSQSFSSFCWRSVEIGSKPESFSLWNMKTSSSNYMRARVVGFEEKLKYELSANSTTASMSSACIIQQGLRVFEVETAAFAFFSAFLREQKKMWKLKLEKFMTSWMFLCAERLELSRLDSTVEQQQGQASIVRISTENACTQDSCVWQRKRENV